MARAVAPSLVSYTEIAYSSGVNMASAAVSWLAGDFIVVIMGAANGGAFTTPTATGLVFTVLRTNTAATTSAAISAIAYASASGSSAISATSPAAPDGGGIWVWRTSDGAGSTAEQHTATKTLSMTPVDTHSAYCYTVFDFNAGAAGDTLLPTPTTVQESALQAANYTVYSGNLNDQASSGATTFGITGAAVTGPFTIMVVEVLGVATPVVQYTRARVRYRA